MDRSARTQQQDALELVAWHFLRTTPQHAAFFIEEDGTILWANHCAGETFGAELDGQPIARCFVDEDVAHGVPEFELNVARTAGWMENDRWMQRADKSRFWAEGVTVALRDEGGAFLGFVKILRNRTTQKMGIEHLRHQIAEHTTRAEQSEMAMFTLAHELRNPLATMMAAAELLDRLPPGDERTDATRATLRRSLNFATRLVDDLVDTTRAATGRLSLDTEVVNVESLLRDAIQAAQRRASGPPCRIDLIVSEPQLQMEADPLRMHQVFVNLVSNAIRYTPREGRAWVTAVPVAGSVVVKVEDTGMGIAPDTLENLFEMFTQARETKTLGGLGIGLSLVQHIVQLHGGTVEAQSDGPGKGSKFIVTLPVTQKGNRAPVTNG